MLEDGTDIDGSGGWSYGYVQGQPSSVNIGGNVNKASPKHNDRPLK